MKFTRRQFLHGTSAATAGLLLPQLADQARVHADTADDPHHDELDPPMPTLVYEGVIKKHHGDREHEYWGYFLSLYGPLDRPSAPVLTHRQAATFLGYNNFEEYANEDESLFYDDDYTPVALNPDDIAEPGIYYRKWFYPYDSFEAVDYAYNYLSNLDRSLRSIGHAGLDCIEFVDKSSHGQYRSTNDCPRYAWVTDKDSLSVLREKLETTGLCTLKQLWEWEASIPVSPNSLRYKLLLEEFVRSAEVI